jgi:hypothetical protein
MTSPQSWQTDDLPYAALVHVSSLANKEHKGNICEKNEYTHMFQRSAKRLAEMQQDLESSKYTVEVLSHHRRIFVGSDLGDSGKFLPLLTR